MKVERIKKVTIELEGEEIDNFKAALKVLNKRVREAGFTGSVITDGQMTILDKVTKELLA